MNDHARAREPDHRGRRARLGRLRADALAFSHPDTRLVAAFDAAREHAITPVRDQGTGTKPRVVEFEDDALTAFSALVIGAREQARTRITALAAERTGPVTAWLIGRYFAFTGDPEAASWLHPSLQALQLGSSLAIATLSDGRPHQDPLLPLVARELIPLAEATGDASVTTTARRLAAGADPGRSVDAVLSRLADVRSAEGRRRPLDVLNALLDGKTENAVQGWQEIATDTTEEERSWIVPLLVAGMLGIDPDAERGRLRLRPHAPADWRDWRADNIRVGDTAVELSVEREGDTIAIRVDQTAGALPLTLILEPTVEAPVGPCFVDGQPADLAVRPFPHRVVVPVQLVLDSPRELRITLDSQV